MSRKITILGIVLGLSLWASVSQADLYSRYVFSIEWLIDTSDVIASVKVVRGGENGKVELEDILKPVERTDNIAWITDDIVHKLKDLKTGHRILILAEKQKGKKAVYLYISLTENALRLSTDEARLNAYFFAVFNLESPQEVCAVLTKHGTLLTDPKQLLSHVRKRLKSPAPQYWERGDSELDNGFTETPGCPVDINETINHITVPPDPEYREKSLRALAGKNGTERKEAIWRLRFWNDAEVVNALKKCLNDDYVEKVWITETGSGSVQRNSYVVRNIAHRSLQKIGVNVPQPKLYAD